MLGQTLELEPAALTLPISNWTRTDRGRSVHVEVKRRRALATHSMSGCSPSDDQRVSAPEVQARLPRVFTIAAADAHPATLRLVADEQQAESSQGVTAPATPRRRRRRQDRAPGQVRSTVFETQVAAQQPEPAAALAPLPTTSFVLGSDYDEILQSLNRLRTTLRTAMAARKFRIL